MKKLKCGLPDVGDTTVSVTLDCALFHALREAVIVLPYEPPNALYRTEVVGHFTAWPLTLQVS